jgi:integrase
MTTPKSRRSRRTLEAGPVAITALEEQWQATTFHDDEDLVFGHPTLGTPFEPSKLTRTYARPALQRAGLPEAFRPWHDLHHTALTHAAALHPTADVQQQAGHANSSTTDRYVQLARARFPGAAAETKLRMFGKSEAVAWPRTWYPVWHPPRPGARP